MTPNTTPSTNETITIYCSVCQHSFEFDGSNIPTNAKYEVICPKCGTRHLRRKI